jgi:mRNA interferase RelE/StbE
LAWTVEVSDFAQRQIQGLDRPTQEKILHYLDERIEGCKNSRHFGEPLKADLEGLWRYRVGDYRVICRIEDERIIFLVLNIGHRRDIYT